MRCESHADAAQPARGWGISRADPPPTRKDVSTMTRRTKKRTASDTYTHIAVLLDRTGSMESIRDDTIGGFNSFLDRQRSEPGTATLTLVQFDSQDPYEVIHRFAPIGEVQPLSRETYVPRAMTPLLDALGRAINDLERDLGELGAKERPEKIVFAVVTDGQENASREFSREQVAKMIEEKTERDKWQFVFLSADLAAIGDAESVGIASDATMLFDKSPDGCDEAWTRLACATADYRASRTEKVGLKRGARATSGDAGEVKSGKQG